jgi:hypothetical protein
MVSGWDASPERFASLWRRVVGVPLGRSRRRALDGGFRARSIEGNEFEISDQWMEVVPTDQVAEVVVQYDPITGRKIAPA